MRKTLLIVVCALALTACFQQEKWTAFVYPDIDDVPKAGDVQKFAVGEYKSFEECQEVAIARVNYNLQKTGRQGDYECGLNCTFRDEYGGLFMCKSTQK